MACALAFPTSWKRPRTRAKTAYPQWNESPYRIYSIRPHRWHRCINYIKCMRTINPSTDTMDNIQRIIWCCIRAASRAASVMSSIHLCRNTYGIARNSNLSLFCFACYSRFRYDRVTIQSYLRSITIANTRLYTTATGYVYRWMGLIERTWSAHVERSLNLGNIWCACVCVFVF